MAIVNDLDKPKTAHQHESYESLTNTAAYLFKNGKYTAALPYYKRIMRQWPKASPTILIPFEKQLAKSPTNIELGLSLAELYLVDGSDQEAIDIYEELIEEDPLNTLIYKQLGGLLLKMGRYEDLVLWLKKPYACQVYDEELVNLLAASYIELNQLDPAIAVYEKLIELNGQKEGYLRTLSDLYLRQGRISQAAQTALRRIEINKNSHPDVIRFLEKCHEQDPELKSLAVELINLYVYYSQFDRAVFELSAIVEKWFDDLGIFVEEQLDQIIKDALEHVEARFLRAECYLRHDRISEAVEDLWVGVQNPLYADQAVEKLKRVLSDYPQQGLALQYLVEYYRSKPDTNETLFYMRKLLQVDFSKSIAVISQCRDLVEADPRNFQAKLTMAEAYFKRENYHEVIPLATELVKRRENVVDAYRLLLGSLGALRDFGSMREVLNQGLESMPEDQEFYKLAQSIFDRERVLRREFFLKQFKEQDHLQSALQFIRALLESSQYEKAMVELQKLVKQGKHYKIYYYQAMAFLGMKQYHSAIDALDRAQQNIYVDTSPEYILMLERKARTYEILGEIDNALGAYRAILDRDFGREDIQQKVEFLKDCPYLDVTGKALAVISEDLEGKNLRFVFNRNRLRSKLDDDIELSMGIAKNNEAVNDLFNGKMNAGSALIDLALKIDNEHKNILNNKAVLMILKKDWLEAGRLFEQLLKKKKNVAVLSLYHMAFILLYGMRKPDEAEQVLNRLLEFEDQFFEAHLLAGDIYFYQSRLGQARSSWTLYRDYGLCPWLASQRLLEVEFIQ